MSAARKPKAAAALFDGYVLENGKRRRATRAELREAHRLWWKHADIRTGRASAPASRRFRW